MDFTSPVTSTYSSPAESPRNTPKSWFKGENKRRPSPLLLAVLIDADNVPAKYADAILREVTKYGDPVLRRVYGDWSSRLLSPWREKTRALGLVERQQMTTVHGKNASDIGLVIDCMDLLFSKRYDGFVLVSSDSDFTQLASRLREDGRMVIGIGEERTPNSLRMVCSKFLLIEKIDNSVLKLEPPENALLIILAAMEKIEPHGTLHEKQFLLAAVGNKIRSAAPDFDPRLYGASKLLDLVKLIPQLELDRKNSHPTIKYTGPTVSFQGKVSEQNT